MCVAFPGRPALYTRAPGPEGTNGTRAGRPRPGPAPAADPARASAPSGPRAGRSSGPAPGPERKASSAPGRLAEEVLGASGFPTISSPSRPAKLSPDKFSAWGEGALLTSWALVTSLLFAACFLISPPWMGVRADTPDTRRQNSDGETVAPLGLLSSFSRRESIHSPNVQCVNINRTAPPNNIFEGNLKEIGLAEGASCALSGWPMVGEAHTRGPWRVDSLCGGGGGGSVERPRRLAHLEQKG